MWEMRSLLLLFFFSVVFMSISEIISTLTDYATAFLCCLAFILTFLSAFLYRSLSRLMDFKRSFPLYLPLSSLSRHRNSSYLFLFCPFWLINNLRSFVSSTWKQTCPSLQHSIPSCLTMIYPILSLFVFSFSLLYPSNEKIPNDFSSLSLFIPSFIAYFLCFPLFVYLRATVRNVLTSLPKVTYLFVMS